MGSDNVGARDADAPRACPLHRRDQLRQFRLGYLVEIQLDPDGQGDGRKAEFAGDCPAHGTLGTATHEVTCDRGVKRVGRPLGDGLP